MRYRMFIPKKAVSLTLDERNLLWIRSQFASGKRRSLSEAVDRILTTARTGGQVAEESIRSVVNTLDLPSGDPDLAAADAAIVKLFAASAQQAWLVRESGT
jgi:hypothetical protein